MNLVLTAMAGMFAVIGQAQADASGKSAAAETCGRIAFSSDRAACQKELGGDFDKRAVEICAGIPFASDVTACIGAIRDRRYAESKLQACSAIPFASSKIECLREGAAEAPSQPGQTGQTGLVILGTEIVTGAATKSHAIGKTVTGVRFKTNSAGVRVLRAQLRLADGSARRLPQLEGEIQWNSERSVSFRPGVAASRLELTVEPLNVYGEYTAFAEVVE